LLLERVVALLSEHGYRIGNIDSTIAMQRPKLRSHIDQMRANIAASAGIDAECVSVKATTTEHLGFEGEEKGVSATAVVLIYKES
jgi:2-C-methyl-D-erythritol 2,4-cyclodiphosphate synthase